MAADAEDDGRDFRVAEGDEVRGARGTYRVGARVGRGGYAVVTRGTRVDGGKGEAQVALKFLAPPGVARGGADLERVRERFANEARALMKIESPNVVKVLDMGDHEGISFLVLEFIEGLNLYDWLNAPGFRVTIEWVEALMDALCEAVAVVHETPIEGVAIAHRDIKPENVLLDVVDGCVRVKLIDFGVARVGRDFTVFGEQVGHSPDYAAPEQLPGAGGETGTWSDVFALAVLLFNLGASKVTVTGAKDMELRWCLFAGHSGEAEVRAALRAQAAFLPDAVREVMVRCFRARTDLRPQDARALQRELRAAWAKPASVVERVKKWFAPERKTPTLAPPVTLVRMAPTRVRGALEPWQRAAGEDAYGRWAEFAVGEVVVKMRWIPAGSFLMGSPEGEPGRFEWEGPQHEVTLTEGFWLGETPVTQALWEAVMGENPSRFKGAERPVEQVIWDDCQRFCAAVNERVPGMDAGLPTEAQWEYACRGGTTGATWAGGNDAQTLDAIAWWSGNSGGETHPVRQKAANRYGLHDMLGNVWEWCVDSQRPYSATAVRDPYGPMDSPSRVYRGGSWSSRARSVRAAFRVAFVPSSRDGDLGFRLARGQGVCAPAQAGKPGT
ncbi:MAG: bifunctional serine/threonine-protein kinase/formylglycine-generating enzyme family protein [Polyangiales bacterium]